MRGAKGRREETMPLVSQAAEGGDSEISRKGGVV